MVRRSPTTEQPTTTTSSSASAAAQANAKTPMPMLSKDDVTMNGASPPMEDKDGNVTAATAVAEAEADPSACRPEHAFHAFDALYCALTRAKPIKPLFPDDK